MRSEVGGVKYNNLNSLINRTLPITFMIIYIS